MSAWIVSKAHIDLLVHALTVTELVAADPDEIGRELWRENHRSVNARYGKRTRTPRYEYVAPTAYREDHTAWGYAAGCYHYQSCEHGGWDSSKACGWIAKLSAALDSEGYEHPEFGKYPWGFAESDVRPLVKP